MAKKNKQPPKTTKEVKEKKRKFCEGTHKKDCKARNSTSKSARCSCPSRPGKLCVYEGAL